MHILFSVHHQYHVNGEMRKAFIKFPEIMTIDRTFKVNSEHYLFHITIGQNGSLKGVPISYGFMRSEIDPHLQFFTNVW